MARNAQLKLGLAGIPVKVEKAVDDRIGPAFHNVCVGTDEDDKHDPTRVKSTLACPTCDNADRGTFKKAIEVGDGKVKVITQEEQKQAGAVDTQLKQVINLTPHPRKDVAEHCIRSGGVYRLDLGTGASPDEYAMFVALVKSLKSEVLVTEWAWSNPKLYEIGVYDDVLVMYELMRPEQVRPVPKIGGKADKATLDMAKQLAKMAAKPFDPANYHDTRSEAIQSVLAGVKEVQAADDPNAPTNTGEAAPTGSLADQLKATLAAAESA